MNAHLEMWSRAWAEWAVAASWQIAVLVALVALAAFLSRRLSARFRYLLWMLVVIKALMPPSLGTAWSIGNWGNWARPHLGQVSVTIAPDPVKQDEAAAGEAANGTYGTYGTDANSATAGNGMTVAAERISLSAGLLVVWSVGLVGLLVFIVARYWRLTRILARAHEVDEGPLRVALEKLAIKIGRENPPALLLSDAVSSPFLFGLFNPRIVLPAGLPEELDAGQIEDVLLHELIHWRRRDIATGWLQIFVQAIFWFHPLVWLAGAQLRHERECACDEAALESGCSEARRYGESLLKVLLAARGRSAVALGFLGVFERNTRLQTRLEEIMNQENRVRRLNAWSWLALVVFAALCLPMAAQNSSMSNSASPEATALNQKAESLYQQKQYREAIAAYQQVVDKYPNWNYAANAMMMVGICQGNLGEETKAIESMNQAIAKYPAVRGFSEAIYLNLMAMYLSSGQTGEAIECIKGYKALVDKGALNRKPDSFFGNSESRDFYAKVMAGETPMATAETDAAKVLLNKAESLYKQKNFRDAIPVYQEFANKYPKYNTGAAHALMMVGICYDRMGEQAKAIEAMNQAIAKYPDVRGFSEAIYLNLMSIYFHSGKTAEATDLIKRYKALVDKGDLDRIGESFFGNPVSREFYAKQMGTAGSAAGQGGGWESKLTDDQRTFMAWTNRSFDRMLDKRDFSKWSSADRDALLAQCLQTLGGPQNQQYYQAINTLGAIGDRKAVKPLLAVATDRIGQDCRDNWMAARALGMIGDPSAIPELIHLTYHTNTNVHFWAQISLVRLTDQNFGYDWKKWGEWWNAQGGQPPFNPTKIRWWDDPKFEEASTAEALAKGDRNFIARIKNTGSGTPVGPPKIISTSPAVGETEVDPAITEITVTFDRDMDVSGYSFTGGGPAFPKSPEGVQTGWRDKRTCVMPVELEMGKYYRVGINSSSYQNFRSAGGMSVLPSAIYFTTKGASPELVAKVQKPVIVSMEPANGATDVDPGVKELRVTFNVPMGSGCSWVGGGENFPTIPEGQRAHWSDDRKTAILPVSLKPNWEYNLGINSVKFNNFQSEGGVPVEPVEYSFKTK